VPRRGQHSKRSRTEREKGTRKKREKKEGFPSTSLIGIAVYEKEERGKKKKKAIQSPPAELLRA